MKCLIWFSYEILFRELNDLINVNNDVKNFLWAEKVRSRVEIITFFWVPNYSWSRIFSLGFLVSLGFFKVEYLSPKCFNQTPTAHAAFP